MVQTGKRLQRERDRRPLLIAAVFVLMLVSGIGAWPQAQKALCPSILIASSNEKAQLMTQLAADYSSTHGSWWSGCGPRVRVENVASGDAENQLALGWPGVGRPDVWTPAAATWVMLLQSKRSDLVPSGQLPSVATSPLVVAMPDPMAQAMHWPSYQPTWSELFQFASDPRGWARFGHPEWGPFRLGMTDPRTSTSGLHTLIAAYDAATGTLDPTLPDIMASEASVSAVEASVSHYASTAGIFLDNMASADSLSYASAVPVEEQEVFSYNEGLHSSERPKMPPRILLDAIYPAGGTLTADHPFAVLRAPWVDQAKSNIANSFLGWLQDPDQQRRFTDSGFRDHNGLAGDPLATEPGIVKARPRPLLPPSSVQVVAAIKGSWGILRKPARIAIVLDAADRAEQVAVHDSIGELRDSDQVEVWSAAEGQPLRILESTALAGPGRARVLKAVDAVPLSRGPVPLYLTIKYAYESQLEHSDAAHIDAIVVTASQLDDGLTERLTSLEREIRGGTSGIRIYAVAWHGGDGDALQSIEKASGSVPAVASSPAAAIRTSLGNY